MEVERTLFLSLTKDLWIAHITVTPTALCVQVISTQRSSHCPLCGQASRQVHSRYQRVVADVSCGSQQVRLHLDVRRFFCRTPTCPRKIFAERLPALAKPSASMTNP